MINQVDVLPQKKTKWTCSEPGQLPEPELASLPLLLSEPAPLEMDLGLENRDAESHRRTVVSQ
jgi:hypothetical protein